MKVFDLVISYVQSMIESELEGFSLDEDNIENLKADCAVLDEIIQSWEPESIDVDIVTDKKLLMITLYTDTITIDGFVNDYYKLFADAVSFGFWNDGDGSLVLSFVFDGVFTED